jgi:hypothetical protein
VRAMSLPWHTWCAVIAELREEALPSMLDDADRLEQQLAQHPPDPVIMPHSLIDDLFLRSCNWTRWPLGILLPMDGRECGTDPFGRARCIRRKARIATAPAPARMGKQPTSARAHGSTVRQRSPSSRFQERAAA